MQEHAGLAGIVKRVVRPRTLVYTAILAAVVAAAVVALFMRVPLKVDVIRDRGAMVREVEDGELENVYRLQVMNATEIGAPLPHRRRGPARDPRRLRARDRHGGRLHARLPGAHPRARGAGRRAARRRSTSPSPPRTPAASRYGRRPSSSRPERTGIERRDRRRLPPRPRASPGTASPGPGSSCPGPPSWSSPASRPRSWPSAGPTAWSPTTTTSRASGINRQIARDEAARRCGIAGEIRLEPGAARAWTCARTRRSRIA